MLKHIAYWMWIDKQTHNIIQGITYTLINISTALFYIPGVQP